MSDYYDNIVGELYTNIIDNPSNSVKRSYFYRFNINL